jgi:hypothetical protein
LTDHPHIVAQLQPLWSASARKVPGIWRQLPTTRGAGGSMERWRVMVVCRLAATRLRRTPTSAVSLTVAPAATLCTRWRASGGARRGLVLLGSPEQWACRLPMSQWASKVNKTRPEGAAQLGRDQVPRPWRPTQPPKNRGPCNFERRAPICFEPRISPSTSQSTSSIHAFPQ